MAEPYIYTGAAYGKDGEWTNPAKVRFIEVIPYEEETDHWSHKKGIQQWVTTVEVILEQGKNRQIRRLVKRSKLILKHLHRCSLGPLCLDGLEEGRCRSLTYKEVQTLYSLVLPLDPVPVDSHMLKGVIMQKLPCSSKTEIDTIADIIFSYGGRFVFRYIDSKTA